MPLAKVGDINMEYYVEGKGQPLLMIMGLGGQASSWGERFLELLRPHFQVIRFSNRGTGLTDKPQAEYSIRMMADDAAGLLRELGIERAHVFGVSMGGMVAQELMLNHPQRVQGLVLGATMCGGEQAVQIPPDLVKQMLPEPGLSPEEQIRKNWPLMTTPEFAEREREFLEEMLRIRLENPTPVDALMRQMTAVQAFDTYDRLPDVQAPTLIIHGDRDQVVPVQNGHILQERIASATLRILPGAGHVFRWEFPQESATAIIEYLSSVPAPA